MPVTNKLFPQIGTSLGLAITSSIATATSEKYQLVHPELALDSPEVLMVGFRAAGWTCFAVSVLSFAIAIFGLRGIGIIGRNAEKPETANGGPEIQLSDVEHRPLESSNADKIVVPSAREEGQ